MSRLYLASSSVHHLPLLKINAAGASIPNTASTRSEEDVFAAVLLNFCVLYFNPTCLRQQLVVCLYLVFDNVPPNKNAQPITNKRFERIDPNKDAWTTRSRLFLSANILIISSVAFPNVAFYFPKKEIKE